MSHFLYGSVKPTKTKGIWLRSRRGANPDLDKIIKQSGLLRVTDRVERIIVCERHATGTNKGKVWIEVWCQSVVDRLRKKNRYNVCMFYLDENPEWVCEGDLGMGEKLKQSDFIS